MRELGWYDDRGNLAPLFKTPEQGAAGEAWAATSPRLDGMGGVYRAEPGSSDEHSLLLLAAIAAGKDTTVRSA